MYWLSFLLLFLFQSTAELGASIIFVLTVVHAVKLILVNFQRIVAPTVSGVFTVLSVVVISANFRGREHDPLREMFRILHIAVSRGGHHTEICCFRTAAKCTFEL
jgi:hypothetical protein